MKTPHKDALPCPFCGGVAWLENIPGSWGYTPDIAKLGCHNEECPVAPTISVETEEWKPGRGTYSIKEAAIAKLVQRWNTRSQAK